MNIKVIDSRTGVPLPALIEGTIEVGNHTRVNVRQVQYPIDSPVTINHNTFTSVTLRISMVGYLAKTVTTNKLNNVVELEQNIAMENFLQSLAWLLAKKNPRK